MGKMQEWLSQIKKIMIQKKNPGRMRKGDIEIYSGMIPKEIILEHRRKNLEKIQEAHKN